jgi:hypothetical protein
VVERDGNMARPRFTQQREQAPRQTAHGTHLDPCRIFCRWHGVKGAKKLVSPVDQMHVHGRISVTIG